MIRRALLLTLPMLLVASPVWAQDDDLVPLTPSKPAPRAKTKTKAKPPSRPAKPAPAAAVDDDLAPLVAAKTEILVKLAVEVPGAKLFIDNKEAGTLPQAAREVTPGDHMVLVKRPGFAAVSRKVTVGSGKTFEMTVDLKANMAVLSITSEPSGALIYSAGRPLGTTPLEDVEVAPGNLTLVAKKDGYTEASTQLSTRPGKDYPVSLKLASTAVAVARPVEKPVERPTPKVEDRPQATTLTPDDSVSDTPVAATTVQSNPPIVTRWYFWVGVVVVAGAIAAGTAIGVSQANTTKPLSQQEICGGPCDACINCSAAFKF